MGVCLPKIPAPKAGRLHEKDCIQIYVSLCLSLIYMDTYMRVCMYAYVTCYVYSPNASNAPYCVSAPASRVWKLSLKRFGLGALTESRLLPLKHPQARAFNTVETFLRTPASFSFAGPFYLGGDLNWQNERRIDCYMSDGHACIVLRAPALLRGCLQEIVEVNEVNAHEEWIPSTLYTPYYITSYNCPYNIFHPFIS